MGLTIYVILLLVLIFIVGAPIAFSILISTVIYILFYSDQTLVVVAKQILEASNSFAILCVPFYVVLGSLLGYSGIMSRIVNLSNSIVGHMKGSLAQVNVVASILLAALQGTATTGTAATGGILIPAMKKEGYSPAYAAAITSSAATIGPIIPPSLTFIIYGVSAGLSIGKLFLSGVFPGVLLGIFMMFFVALKARGGEGRYAGTQHKFSYPVFVEGFKQGILTLIIPIIILGGILGGIFTATESGAFAILATIILGLFVYRSMKLKAIWDAVEDVCTLMGNFAILFAAANTFSWVLAREGAATVMAQAIGGLTDNGILVMLTMNLVLLIAGCFIDTISNVILFTPIFLPIATMYGYDPIHFGAILVINLTLGTITPPLGTAMYMAIAIADVKMEDYFKEAISMYVPILILLLLVVFIPQLSLFLPNMFIK